MLTIGVVAGFSASNALAQFTCNTTFTGTIDEDWEDDDNWDNDAPNSTKTACIPDDKLVEIKSAAEAKAIWIQRDGSNRGVLQVCYEVNSLRLYENSLIDGVLQLEGGTDLIVDDSLTITGDGGEISFLAFQYPARILSASANDTLTLQGTDNDSRSTSLVLHGTIEIEAPLVNNAYVVADEGDIVLKTNAKSGNGRWVAGYNSTKQTTGRLIVDVAVSGSGTWELKEHANALIIVNAECTALTGDVIVQKGAINLYADFDTSGNVELKSVSGSNPWVGVAAGVFVAFGQ
jgi:hypothetical protein